MGDGWSGEVNGRDGWVGKVAERTDRRINAWMGSLLDGKVCKWCGWMGGRMEGQMGCRIDGWMDE